MKSPDFWDVMLSCLLKVNGVSEEHAASIFMAEE
jgi:hypothetical protein